MSAIDDLLALNQTTQAKLKEMKDARPSEIMAVREAYGEQAMKLLRQVKDEITPEQKAAAFDKIADYVIGGFVEGVENAMSGNGFYRGKDFDHYVYETAVESVFGPKGFQALNPLENLLPQRQR